MTEEKFEDGALTLRLYETEQAVVLEWMGMSMAREPARFLTPILSRALDAGLQTKKPVVIDFQKLEYFNSSTITPVIRMLEQVRRGIHQVRVHFNKSLKWQSLSFTALELFRTADGRIDVRGF